MISEKRGWCWVSQINEFFFLRAPQAEGHLVLVILEKRQTSLWPICLKHVFLIFFQWLSHFTFLGNQVQYLHRAGRWHWAILSLHHPSPVGAAGWRRRTPSLWEVQTRHCASVCGLESNHRRMSWCPDLGCTGCRSSESTKKEVEVDKKWKRHEQIFPAVLFPMVLLSLLRNCLVQCDKCDKLTSISRQAALSRVIWSAMVNVVKPGNCLANSTVLMMHLVDSSLNLSQRLTSRATRCSELLLCR